MLLIVFHVRGHESKQDSYKHTMLLTYSAEVVFYIIIFLFHIFTHAQVNDVMFTVQVNIFIAAAADSSG